MKIISHKSARLVVVVMVVAAAIVVALSLQERKSVTGYKNQLLARGEKLSILELIPPAVADSSNAAPALLALTNELHQVVAASFLATNPPPAMHFVAPGKAMVGWKRPEIRAGGVTNSWEELNALLASATNALAQLQSLVTNPVLSFTIDFAQGPSLLLPHLVPVKQSADLLSAATLASLHRGDVPGAVLNLRALLALIHSTQDEPLVISQLLRVAMTYQAFNLTWELLQSNGLTEDQLAALQRDWAGEDFLAAGENALLMERAMIENTLKKLRQSRRPLVTLSHAAETNTAPAPTNAAWIAHVTELSKSAWQDTKELTREAMWRYSWSYSDELKALKGGRALIDALNQAQAKGFFKDALRTQNAKLEQLDFGKLTRDTASPSGSELANADIRWFFSRSVQSLEDFPKRLMTEEAARLTVVTVLALQRYHLRHGSYPGDLNALVPDLLPAVPRDPVDGKPLRYQLVGKSFLLYSVGEDGVDNGGDPATGSEAGPFSWSSGHDYVWPSPATEKEIVADEQKLTFKGN
ncbi:MAG: hypothetical protein U1F98_09000 [Verrucomicrobiota bacterium]